MGMTVVMAPSADAARLRALGFEPTDTVAPNAGIAEALARGGAVAVVAERPADRPAARADLAAVTDTDDDAPLALVVLPAVREPLPGPVAIVTPAETVSAYDLYVGAAIAASTRRRVVHLSGRGTAGSAVHSGIAGRVLARSTAPGWREFPHSRPERSLHTLTSRPGAIVVAVPPGSTEADRLIADHPDADVVLVFDRAHARHGAAVAQQVSSMVELAFSLAAPAQSAADESPDAPADEPTRVIDDPASDLPGIRASDVIHVRLTDTALELTNRTAQRLRVHVALGDVENPDVARAEFECALAPRSAHAEPTADAQGLDDLEPPRAVMRHWSHESEEVYEGGRQRILSFRVDVLDADDAVHATRVYRPGNGLDFFVTARDLTALIGRPVTRSVLPEPAPAQISGTAPTDVLAALASAVAVGAQVLTARER